MHGVIRKRDIITHPVTTIQCFGWEVFIRSLLANRDRTFLSIVEQTTLSPTAVAELPELTARAIRIELRAMGIYHALAQRFVDAEPVHELFVDLARQEASHAELLELCHTSSATEGWTEEHLEPWCEVLTHLEEEMPSVERRVEQIGGVEDALRLVIDLESSEINDAFMGILDASPSTFVRAVKAFRSSQEEHIELICGKIPALASDLAEACQALREKHR